MEKEQWKPLIYNGENLGYYYLVSNIGNIKGIKSGKIRSLNVNHEGYYFVSISLGSRQNKITIKVHKAVAENFVDNSENFPIVNHKDGNKLNNYYNNLEWCTYQHNTIHAFENNLIKGCLKEIICLNTLDVFKSIQAASEWCCLTDCAYSIRKSLNNIPYKYSGGKSPYTNEKLYWMYYKDYLKSKFNADSSA